MNVGSATLSRWPGRPCDRIRPSGKQLQRRDVSWNNGAEVTLVERGDLTGPEPLGGGDHRRISDAEGKAHVLAHQLSHPDQVAGRNIDLIQVACGERLNKIDLSLAPTYLPTR